MKKQTGDKRIDLVLFLNRFRISTASYVYKICEFQKIDSEILPIIYVCVCV